MIIAATGHRPDKLGGYGYKTEQKLLSLALVYLEDVQPEKVITGMALGWDTAVAMAAYCLSIPFIAAVPFTGQHYKWDPEHIRRYHEILTAAESVHTITAGGYSARAMEIRDRWMVDHAGRVVALWSGVPSGTGTTIRYAKRKKVEVDNLWTRWRTGHFDLDLAI